MAIKTEATICAKRLCLRQIADADLPALVAILKSSKVAKTYMLPEFSSDEEALQLAQRLQMRSRDEDRFVYGICLPDRLIGFLNDVEMKDGQIELGYVIDPDHNNQGYATEAVGAAMQALFSGGFTTVIAGAFEGNIASMRVMEKCGMERTGFEEMIEYRGVAHRCIYYAKSRPTDTTAAMRRIMVIGCPGSGKSTFSRRLQEITRLPLYHLDLLYWNADRTTVEKPIFLQRLSEILEKDSWIIDGNYGSTMELRLRACDTVIFLDYPETLCAEGIRQRKGKPRADMPWVEAEGEEDREFSEFVRKYRAESRPEVLALLEWYPEKRRCIFTSRSDAEAFLRRLQN